MPLMSVYQQILENKHRGGTQVAVLVDPEQQRSESFEQVALKATESGVDFIFVGGSLLLADALDSCIHILRQNTQLPIVLFPGSHLQIHPEADAILLLSLISGRNPELLIGQHVVAAPYLRRSGLEIIATGYMLVGSENYTTAHYISHSFPIPGNKPDVAACTAMAGEMLGMKLIYLDAGSGAYHPVSSEMISKVKAAISIPIIVGGGINHPDKAKSAAQAGADLLVVGNSLEKDLSLMLDIAQAAKNQ
ncbi:MAG: hypothetical protein PWR20_2033 [Bacteroidales bacterium]|nr:hypothetical protein [Bacteroidales bacterium]MDN5329242.1 hypothetical protein [Bacteroidales bacterium]